ncbi:MAG: bifunctional diaminohydroxyphosphoribosylaminopyrimidine deaminase/5-amino-6-(5-phosphoribosylamino)uracil reductase RibD [Pseudomonadota bacterium]
MAQQADSPSPSRLEDAKKKYMKVALRLAARGKGRTSPNPPVGAVVVAGGRIVGRGWHRGSGLPHAEVEALRAAGEAARGASVYVTLEPCNHQGRTPPCTEALLAAGVAEVVYGQKDPNPRVAGGGAERLRAAGVRVSQALEAECARFNEAWTKWITSGMPFGLLKGAISLDGRIATSGGDSKWISSEDSRRLAHRLRAECDAIVVGIGTALADDPQLTCRAARGEKNNPLRVIVDSSLRLPPTARMLTCSGRTLVACVEGVSSEAARSALTEAGAEILALPPDDSGRVNLQALFRELGRRGVCGVLIEGGSELNASALAAGLVDKLLLFVAPRLLGGRDAVGLVGGGGAATVAEGWRLRYERVRRVGCDLLIEAYPVRP